MYLGRIVESGSWHGLWTRPMHPYTRALVQAVPDPARRRQAAPLTGDLPSARHLPSGCRFHPRCPIATPRCAVDEPVSRDLGQDRTVACHHADEAPLH